LHSFTHILPDIIFKSQFEQASAALTPIEKYVKSILLVKIDDDKLKNASYVTEELIMKFFAVISIFVIPYNKYKLLGKSA